MGEPGGGRRVPPGGRHGGAEGGVATGGRARPPPRRRRRVSWGGGTGGGWRRKGEAKHAEARRWGGKGGGGVAPRRAPLVSRGPGLRVDSPAAQNSVTAVAIGNQFSELQGSGNDGLAHANMLGARPPACGAPHGARGPRPDVHAPAAGPAHWLVGCCRRGFCREGRGGRVCRGGGGGLGGRRGTRRHVRARARAAGGGGEEKKRRARAPTGAGHAPPARRHR